MRNSSLVEYFRAENVPGLEHTTEFADYVAIRSGRGAFHMGRSTIERTCGLYGSENAGVSNEKTGENPVRQKLKVSRGRFVLPGLVGA